MCWGQNFDGQLGDGSTDDADDGVPVAGVDDIDQVTGGWGHSCALKAGTVWCWGSNVGGLLGRGFVSERETVPEAVRDLSDVVAIDSGYYRTCAVTANGSLYCWGGGDLDQPGTVVSSPKCIDLVR
jgi:alpha-tubulin suppressor-like RCC1 family protein